ncbi:MAG: RimK/LysX family protein [Lutibacter sp.]|nr:RimK/LysX family protein [Lutibacter sp.]MDO9595091.1 RimK/LysX family protein [Lutibacter sp.]
MIGRTDVVDFPKLELFNIDIKVDSGAFTSSFHCHSIEEVNNVLKCQFLDPKHEKYHEKYFTFTEFTQKMVKSSNGIIENRYLIKTEILIFNEIHSIELSLTERGSMKFPVLLGRKFLTKKFVVDAAKKNLSFKNIVIKI